MVRFILFIFTFFPIIVNAQLVRQANFDNYEIFFSGDKLNADEFEGSAYLDESWKKAKITINGKSLEYKKARYNIYYEIMEVMIRSDHKYIDSKNISRFQFLDKSVDTLTFYVPQADIPLKGKKLNGFVKTTIVGEYQVISSYEMLMRKASKENPLLAGVENKGRLITKIENYIRINDTLHKIKKEKDFLNLFRDKSKILKNYAKDEGIDAKTHSGLVALLKEVGNGSL